MYKIISKERIIVKVIVVKVNIVHFRRTFEHFYSWIYKLFSPMSRIGGGTGGLGGGGGAKAPPTL